MTKGSIRRLDESVINRIAAGEVIQRPCNVLKELLENSLDAGATNIRVLTKDGGLKMLQIVDNGSGISVDDMELVCERFATSKLETYEDLYGISTFGFRGEALASISHVAQLTILTKQANEQCAYTASYTDGKVTPGTSIKPCAGNQGTQITVENLFYNVPTRKKAFKSGSGEYLQILDVLQKYAIHYAGVAMSLQKVTAGQIPKTELSTSERASTYDAIKTVYGASVARDLAEFGFSNTDLELVVRGFVATSNFQHPKPQFILFINHRLVESPRLKRAILDVYSAFLSKGARPFVYLDLQLAPQNVDVNVHPTKSQVMFLREGEIISAIADNLEEFLRAGDTGRVYAARKTNLGALPKSASYDSSPSSSSSQPQSASKQTTQTPAHKLIRTDASAQKLDLFFPKLSGDTASELFNPVDLEAATLPLSTSSFSASSVCSFTNKDLLKRKFDHEAAEESTLAEKVNTSSIQRCTADFDDTLSVTDFQLSAQISECNAKGISQKPLSPQGPFVLNYPPIPIAPTELEPPLSNLADCMDVSPSVKMSNEPGSSGVKGFDKFVCKDPKLLASGVEAKLQTNVSLENSQRLENSSAFVDVKLSSVLELREEVCKECSDYLLDLCSSLVFVGVVDPVHVLAQAKTKLFLMNIFTLSSQMFYQLALRTFHNFGVIQLSSPACLRQEVGEGIAQVSELNGERVPSDISALVENATKTLCEKAPMLKEYFGIEIDCVNVRLNTLPLMLKGYIPLLDKLPLFLIRLAFHVDWNQEKPCFRHICRELGYFYAAEEPWPEPNSELSEDADPLYLDTLEHIIFPALKDSFFPSSSLLSIDSGTLHPPNSLALVYDALPSKDISVKEELSLKAEAALVQVADLPDLYKVFERC